MRMVSYNILSAVVFKIKVANVYKFNVMFGQNLSATIVIDFPLLTTDNPTNSFAFIKEWHCFCMLSLTILYNKILFLVISIDRQCFSRVSK